MSLKCSIFGHKYTEPDVERERNEQGSEVVITIRELESCERCGHTRVVSENKEVTTLETPDVSSEEEPPATAERRVTGDSPGPGGADAATGQVQGSAHGEGAEARDAEILEDDSGPEVEGEAAGGAAASDHHPADEVIQEAPGSEPAADAGPEAEEPADDDGVILEAEDEEAETQPRQPGEWPQEADDESEPDWVQETEHTAPTVDESGPEIESAGSAVTVPDGQFYCGECGFRTEVESSSLRAGDFCPECQQGTLQHRPGED